MEKRHKPITKNIDLKLFFVKDLYQKLEEMGETYLSGVFPGGKPKVIYHITGNYEIESVDVIDISIVRRFTLPEKYKKITDADLKKILNCLAPPFTPNDIRVVMKEKESSSSTVTIQLGYFNGYNFNKDELIPRATKQKELYGAKDGYLPCAYCRIQRKLEDLKQDIIISPNWQANNYKSPPRNYCKDKPCHSHDQMGHEG